MHQTVIHLPLTPLPQPQIKAQDYSADTLHLTSALLTQNPEYYTIWNWRRLLLLDVFNKELASSANEKPNPTPANPTPTSAQQELSLLISEDLAFLLPLLKQFPKCYWIWNHRSWLLQTATTHLLTATSLQFWQQELKLVSKMLDLDARNFHGWGYRREVVGNIEALLQRQQQKQEQEREQQPQKPQSQEQDQPQHPNDPTTTTLTSSELTYTTTKISANLSNFSAWHYRSQLLPKALKENLATSGTITTTSTRQQSAKEMLQAEFDLLTRALYTDPYDQSLWSYHRFLVSVLSSSYSLSSSADRDSGILTLEPADSKGFLSEQLHMLRELREDAEDCKFVLLALMEVAGVLNGRDEGVVFVGKAELGEWSRSLRELDPLREGRWRDMEGKLGV